MTPPAAQNLITSIDAPRPQAESVTAIPGLPFEVRSVGLANRAFDITVTLLLLPLVLLIGGLIAVIIFVDSPGPVFYRCIRVGHGGRRFEMLKFRKMTRHATGGMLTVADDERFTPIGRFLTVTKLDEMPQLWNVLKGEMRLVGPRPEVEPFVARYADEYREILTVVPGITGPAAIECANEGALLAGHQDITHFYCSELLPHKIEADLAYIHNRSLRGDVALLLRTGLTPVQRLAWRFGHLRDGDRSAVFRHLAWCGAAIAIITAFAFSLGSPV